MSDSKRYFNPIALSPIASLWPFAGWAALLHLGVIGGYMWQNSFFSPPQGLLEGSPIEVVYIESTPPPAAPVTEPLVAEKASSPIKVPISHSIPTLRQEFGPQESPKEARPVAKPSLLLQFGNPNPPYPESAREKMIEGKVSVVLTVEASTGGVQKVEVISKSPPILIESVLMTVKKWRFQPLDSFGKVLETVHFDFCLE